MARGKKIDTERLLDMARQGYTTQAIADALDIDTKTVLVRRREANIAPPPRGGAVPPPAVRMPEGDLAKRADFPEIVTALQRCRGSAVGVAQIAARFRLPYAVLNGLAQRVTA